MTEKVSLCKDGHCCPAVELGEAEVRIGEEGNLVKLSKEEWNALVEKIKAGELRPL
ncbi:MAG: hypothetical protein HYU86_08465 [Chloroflexi bacterium]|nr:hypothetical protein [Chloroflexota bacterium]